MPNYAYVEITDTFDTWRQKTNLMMDVVYSLAGSGVISVVSPQNGQILVCNNGIFCNVTPYGDVTGIDTDGYFHINQSIIVGQSKGRLRFAGSMRSLY